MWNIFCWLVLGAVAGFIANQIMNETDKGLARNIVIGILGSMIGGFIARLIGITAKDFSIGGILIAIAGSCLCIWLGRFLFGNKR